MPINAKLGVVSVVGLALKAVRWLTYSKAGFNISGFIILQGSTKHDPRLMTPHNTDRFWVHQSVVCWVSRMPPFCKGTSKCFMQILRLLAGCFSF